MSTLYIRLPSHAIAGTEPHWPELPCAFAVVSNGRGALSKGLRPGGTIEREGVRTLAELAGAIADAQCVVLLLAAVDVALLHLKIPPLSGTKLKAALPNLVEDQLIDEPSGCVIDVGGSHDGLRSVAVVKRAWFGVLTKTLVALGARHIAALPAQLCLPYSPGLQPGQPAQPEQLEQAAGISVAVYEHPGGIDLTIRLSEHDGIGLALTPPAHVEDQELRLTPAHEVIRTLRAVAPGASVTLYVPQAGADAYRQAANGSGDSGNRITVLSDNWTQWVNGAAAAAPDLMAGRAVRRLDWHPWRWPLALALVALLVNIVALNFDWWRKRTEANALRASLTQIYKAAYPKESVIVDPIAQIRQKIAIAKRNAGVPSPDDFVALTAAFGEAAAVAMPGRTAAAIAAIEYRERSLFIQLKPGIEVPIQRLKTLLVDRKLSLEQTGSGAAVLLQIRSTK